MTHRFLTSSAFIIALAAPLGACGSSVVVGPDALSALPPCPRYTHTEAYPNNPNPRYAYKCVPELVGFIRSPGDSNERMTPQ